MSGAALSSTTSAHAPLLRPEPTTPSSRIRAATVRRRVLLVTDVLAAADLLLGMNKSVRALGADTSEEKR